MSIVPVWRLFAFNDDEDESHDERRLVADWQLQDVLRWCTSRGFDHIYFSRSPDTTEFKRARPSVGVRHEWGDSGVIPGPVA